MILAACFSGSRVPDVLQHGPGNRHRLAADAVGVRRSEEIRRRAMRRIEAT